MSIRKNNDAIASDGRQRAVSYARVSSKEQEMGYSIQAQQELHRSYEAKNNLLIEKEFVDVETAKQAGRPGFDAMVQYIVDHPGCRAIVVEKTDRLYRNMQDFAQIEAMGIAVHLIKENLVITKDSSASEKRRHRRDVVEATGYSENLSEEVRKGLRTKAAEGLWPSFAPLGYRNTVCGDGKKTIQPDPVFGPILTEVIELFFTGEYSIQRLASRAYDTGLRFRKSNGRIPVSTLQKILRNPIYMGEFDFGGVRYKGIHEPLVSRQVWDRIQEILDGRNRRKNRKVTHDFAFSGMVACGHCGCSMVGEVKKGRYVYYHCTGYRGKCGEPYTREETLRRGFANDLRELALPPAVLDWLEAEQANSEETAQTTQMEAIRRHEADLERLRRRREMLYEDRLDGRIDAATHDAKVAQIQVQQKQIQERIGTAEIAMAQAQSSKVNLKLAMRRIAELFLVQSAREQRRLLHLILGEGTWKRGALHTTLREPFEGLRVGDNASALAPATDLR